MEHGSIQVPHVPVLRTATPIHTPDGKPFGIVIINVDLRMAFARVRPGTDPSAQTYLVNEQGDYLIHPDQAREFGFELGKQFRLQDDFPKLGEAMQQTEIKPGFVDDRAGNRFAVALAPVQLAGGPRVTVVEAVPYSRGPGRARDGCGPQLDLDRGPGGSVGCDGAGGRACPFSDGAAGSDDQSRGRLRPRRAD